MASRKKALRGDLDSINRLKGKLREMPYTVAHDAAKRAAPAMTDETRDSFQGRRSVYGEPWPPSEWDGSPVKMVQTGALRDALRFDVNGRIVRCVLGPKNPVNNQSYGKFMIARFGVLPKGMLPAGWSQRLSEIVKSTKDPLK